MKNVVTMQQVHGNKVVRVGLKDSGTSVPDCDGLVTNDTAVTLSVRVADCLPIVFRDKKRLVIGLAHAGWKGLDKGIIKNAVKLLKVEFSSEPCDLHIEIGPHICAKHYEVKTDVSEKFKQYPLAILRIGGKEYLDLEKVAIEQLINSGVKKANIKMSERCTFEEISLPSFRRDGTGKRLIILAALT